MFVKNFLYVAAAVCYSAAAVAVPVEPRACGSPVNATRPTQPTPAKPAPTQPAASKDPSQQCTDTNRINCDNVGGIHDDKIIGDVSGIIGAGAGCVADCGNSGGNHKDTIIGPGGNTGGANSGPIIAGPGDCVDCGHVGGSFSNTVIVGQDDSDFF